MKKLITFIFALICVLGLAGCSGSEAKVWEWTAGLMEEDITAVTPWCHDAERKEFDPLNDAQTLELVTLLNKLTKKSFTENKQLVGVTPTFGIQIETASQTYHINYSPSPYGKYGTLEIEYLEKLWWIDSSELSSFIQEVTGGNPAA